ncbi:NAD(P)H-dependent flavin oxidoreductase [Melghirimyces algeriensis]|uniref:Probable nitronate monooxygenase n=1 Tax=Melghirimyces algeriensis TaxID=910412 RepID=A0A521ANU3_9BACL|nr:nitronate monooxygenase [Melghirimyces algeriensis]SMO36468.1 nitronate monooxygenase [Melghirimyces algeriensis]
MTWKQTKLTERVNLSLPIVQAGMAGGVTTPDLVAAVSNGGGLGTLGAGYMSPEAMREAIMEIRQKTTRAFAVNLMIPTPYEEDAEAVQQMQDYLHAVEKKRGITTQGQTSRSGFAFEDQLNVVLEEKVPVFSFTFGTLEPSIIQQLQANGTWVMGTATTVKEALALEEQGVDAVVVQGSEAGGHRGTFQHAENMPYIGSMALIPQVADQLSIPVIASGGIMDGRSVLASLILGASGVQMGSAFLTTVESGAHERHKTALLQSTDESTVITKAFSGRPARGMQNAFIQEMKSYSGTIPPYPIQNALTKPLRKAASQQGNTEVMSLWGGQAASLGQLQSAGDLLHRVDQEVTDLVDLFHKM